MGCWSEYVKSTTPDVKVKISKLKIDTHNWIECKARYGVTPITEYSEMSINELGLYFCDTAKIWGYFSDAQGPLNDIAANIDTEFATMIFKCDADDVKYYMLRFDRLLKKCTALVHRTKNYPKKIDDIDWVVKKESEIFSDMYESMRSILSRPGLSKSDIQYLTQELTE